MKRVLILTMMAAFLFAFSDRAPAQVTKTVKKVEKKISSSVEKGIGSLLKKKTSKEEEHKDITEKPAVAVTDKETAGTEQTKPALSWAKYDFVAGDNVIFEDDQLREDNGEFPSRWDLKAGNVEIAELAGEKVIMLRGGAPDIVPYIKDSDKDYLPEVFTIELDLYYPGSGTFHIYLYDRKNQKPNGSGYRDIQVSFDQLQMGEVRSKYPADNLEKNRWMHISIAFNNGQLKAYMDDTRLINIPHLSFNPTGLSLYTYHAANDHLYYVKNVRIAKGGVKYYDRLLQDGKIIANGIRFDSNKATLKPESMGIINEIAGLMKEHPGIKFSVEGHTDSDGDDALNQTLSEQRAATVVSTLIGMGIDTNRLTSKGWGETKPLDNNSSPEGKANNRRVEFIKM